MEDECVCAYESINDINIRKIIGDYKGGSNGGYKGKVSKGRFSKGGNPNDPKDSKWKLLFKKKCKKPPQDVSETISETENCSNITTLNNDVLSVISNYLDPISQAAFNKALENAKYEKEQKHIVEITPPQPDFSSLNCNVLKANGTMSDHKLLLNYTNNLENLESTIGNAQEQLYTDKIFIYSLLKTIVSKYYTLGFIEILMESISRLPPHNYESHVKSKLVISFFESNLNVEFRSDFVTRQYFTFKLGKDNDSGVFLFDFKENCYEINRLIYNIKSSLCRFYNTDYNTEFGIWKSETIRNVFHNAKINRTPESVSNSIMKNVFNILLKKPKVKLEIQSFSSPENQTDIIEIDEKVVPDHVISQLKRSDPSKIEQGALTRPVQDAAKMIITQLQNSTEIVVQAKPEKDKATVVNLLENYANSSEAIILYAKEHELNNLIENKIENKIPLMQFVSHYGSSMTSVAYDELIKKYIFACRDYGGDKFLTQIATLVNEAEEKKIGKRVYFEKNLFHSDNKENDTRNVKIEQLSKTIDAKYQRLFSLIEQHQAPNTYNTHLDFQNTVIDIKRVIASYSKDYDNDRKKNAENIIKKANFDLNQIYINYTNTYYADVNATALANNNKDVTELIEDIKRDIDTKNNLITGYNKNVGNIYFRYGESLYVFNDYMIPLKYIDPHSFQEGGSKRLKYSKTKKQKKPKIKKFVLGIERIVTKDPVTKKEMITYNKAPMFLRDARKLDSQQKREKTKNRKITPK